MHILDTERLRLRTLAAQDAPFYLEVVNTQGFIEFIGDRGIRTVDAAREAIAGGPVAMQATLGHSLYLVERYCGHEIAMQCAKSLLIETSRISQSGFAVLSFNKKHADQSVRMAQDWIEKNYAKDFSFDALAGRLNMSPRNFMRRFRSATDGTPLAYLQRVRMAAAKRALEGGHKPVETISNEVGYEDVAFFRALFRRYVGLNPKAYREKFGDR